MNKKEINELCEAVMANPENYDWRDLFEYSEGPAIACTERFEYIKSMNPGITRVNAINNDSISRMISAEFDLLLALAWMHKRFTIEDRPAGMPPRSKGFKTETFETEDIVEKLAYFNELKESSE